MRLGAADLEVEVRAGTVDDVSLLLSFIRSMAEFEKLEVTATEDTLRESLFGDRPAGHTLFALSVTEPNSRYFYTISVEF